MSELFTQLTAPNGRTWSQPCGLFINGEFVPSSRGNKLTTIDPSTEKEIATVHIASAEDVDKAVLAAHNALKASSWKRMSATERGILMTRLADLLERNKELLATIDAWDNGKTYSEALNTDLPEAILTIRYYAGWADKNFGQTIETTPEKFAYTIRQPVGVVAQIIPWNYPLSMAAWKLGPALACGNTVVIKAAESTPLSILVLGQLIDEAGFPPGVVNVINGYGAEAGAAMAQHELVSKVAFTGSSGTASQIMRLASASLKNITLETGGKSPLLVFPDADMDQAVKWSHMGIMSNQGQICTATSRLLVHQDVYDIFVEKFINTLKATSKVGDQWDDKTYQGPQVSQGQYDRILQYIQVGISEGARVIAGGAADVIRTSKGEKGFFVQPTVFVDVKESMRIYQEEIFGPVVVIAKFSDEEAAIKSANNTTYGLGSAIFTNDLKRAHRVAAEINAGMVWINSTQDCDPRIPFGGVKLSGIGRELGQAGLEAYTQTKAVHVNMGNDL